MRLVLFSLALMASMSLHAQKTLPGKTAKVTTPLPMTLWEYYSTDSISFVYNALGKISAFGSCYAKEDGTVEGFNPTQNALYKIGPYLGATEGSVGYLLMEGDESNQAIESMKQVGLKQLPTTIAEYQKFVRANADALNNGDEAVNTRMWYYDSLIYAQIASAPELDVLYNQFRNTGMFIRQDGKEFDPMASGLIRVATMKGTRLEEVTVEKGVASGSSYSSTATGEPASEVLQSGNWLISKYFNPNGTLASIDSTDTGPNGRSYSRMFFPNGKVNSVYSNDYQYGPDGSSTGGGSREKSYYSNGQLACETYTDYVGTYQVISAFDQKGKSTIKNGTGKVSRETVDYYSGVSTITTNEHVNHMQNGLNEVYVGGKLTNSYVYKDGLMVGTQKSYHWKNGKLIGETTYDDAGNYVSDQNLFDQNAPKIDGNKVKIQVSVEPDMSCTKYGIYDPKFARATLKNEKELKSMLAKKPDLLHYNTPGMMPQDPTTFKYLMVDVSEAGKPINTLEYADQDAEIINLLQFTPATYQGKPIKSRVSVNLIAIWQ